MNIQFAVVDGIRMATLPAEQLERLQAAAEDRADIRAAEAAEARRTAGEEYLPAIMADRIVAGESPLRVWRRYRAFTLAALGKQAGVRASYLSEIELGKKPGTTRLWRALADALDVDIDDILS